MTGKVYLVGAGPGDPDLLTFKAARLLGSADVVLHDDLVSGEILALIPAAAQIHNVGKRCGEKKITQEEIHALMIGFARAGLDVVRLKSGDPVLFGRAGEEIAALGAAGIAFELVPGVTAACGAAAAAQVPLTDRRISPAVVFVSGHHAAGNRTDWRALASLGATLAIYMPGHNYREIAAHLLRAGLPAPTACAIVSRATTPQAETYLTDLAALPEAPRLPAPTLLVVGDVVKLAHPLVADAPASWNCCLDESSAAPQAGFHFSEL